MFLFWGRGSSVGEHSNTHTFSMQVFFVSHVPSVHSRWVLLHAPSERDAIRVSLQLSQKENKRVHVAADPGCKFCSGRRGRA